MLIQYLKADPTGNLTALVESPVIDSLRQSVAAAVMASHGEIEQLGFLSPAPDAADIALSMAGGEFCGNACLSAAAYYLRQNGIDSGPVRVSVSGAPETVNTQLEKLRENEYSGTVEMPLPLSLEMLDSPIGALPIVRFPGISHAIITSPLSPAEAEELIVPLCRQLGAEALGLMLLKEECSSLSPLVYVPGAKSLFWERSCASGTTAVGAYLALREKKDISLCLAQPGGSLSISAALGPRGISRLTLGGKVKLLPSEEIEI